MRRKGGGSYAPTVVYKKLVSGGKKEGRECSSTIQKKAKKKKKATAFGRKKPPPRKSLQRKEELSPRSCTEKGKSYPIEIRQETYEFLRRKREENGEGEGENRTSLGAAKKNTVRGRCIRKKGKGLLERTSLSVSTASVEKKRKGRTVLSSRRAEKEKYPGVSSRKKKKKHSYRFCI